MNGGTVVLSNALAVILDLCDRTAQGELCACQIPSLYRVLIGSLKELSNWISVPSSGWRSLSARIG